MKKKEAFDPIYLNVEWSRMKVFFIFDERSPRTNVGAIIDPARDNSGPLAELWNLDKGCRVAAHVRHTG